METSFLLLLGTVAAAIVFGYVMGKLSGTAKVEAIAQREFQRGKSEAELEKASLALALGDELLKLKDGIQAVANSFESTVRVVHKGLSNNLSPQLIKLGTPTNQPTLQLEIEKIRAQTGSEVNALKDTANDAVELSASQEEAKIGN